MEGGGGCRRKAAHHRSNTEVVVIMNGDWAAFSSSGHLTPTPVTGLQRHNAAANGVFSLPRVPANK